MDPAEPRPESDAAPTPAPEQRPPGRSGRPAQHRSPAAASGGSGPQSPAGGGGGRGRSGREGGRRGQAAGGDRQGAPGERGGPEQRDERKRRREGGREGHDRRSYAGFEDGLERAYCTNFRAAPPPAFPVQSRQGIATLRVLVVGRRPDALLLCDGAHPGPHRWPDGEEVDEVVPDRPAAIPEPQAAVAVDNDDTAEPVEETIAHPGDGADNAT